MTSLAKSFENFWHFEKFRFFKKAEKKKNYDEPLKLQFKEILRVFQKRRFEKKEENYISFLLILFKIIK